MKVIIYRVMMATQIIISLCYSGMGDILPHPRTTNQVWWLWRKRTKRRPDHRVRCEETKSKRRTAGHFSKHTVKDYMPFLTTHQFHSYHLNKQEISQTSQSPCCHFQALSGYFVHYFAPTNIQQIPKNVVFIIDRSGSMHGRKMTQVNMIISVI